MMDSKVDCFKGLFKGTVSPAERCDLGGVKFEKVHELFQVCWERSGVFYMAQYGLLYHKRLCNYYRIFSLYKFAEII